MGKNLTQKEKIDSIYRALMGDELNQYPGLLAEQKVDNAFREKTTKALEEIRNHQIEQKETNDNIEERVSNIEEFVNFFRTLGKIKKTTWVIVGGIAAGFGFVVVKFEQMLKWIHHAWTHLN